MKFHNQAQNYPCGAPNCKRRFKTAKERDQHYIDWHVPAAQKE